MFSVFTLSPLPAIVPHLLFTFSRHDNVQGHFITEILNHIEDEKYIQNGEGIFKIHVEPGVKNTFVTY